MLTRLRPRDETQYVSQSRTVLATDRNGWIVGDPSHGLFVYQTRLLSRYRYLVNGQPLQPAGLSNIEQHSWLGYYITGTSSNSQSNDPTSPGVSATQQTVELRLSRFVGEGLHEDVDVTNFSQQPVSLRLDLEVDADFADQAETDRPRQQRGKVRRHWRQATDEKWELIFDYAAQHDNDSSAARLSRGLTLRVEQADSPPRHDSDRLVFHLKLNPHAQWHACLNLIPRIEERRLVPLYRCRSFAGIHHERDARRERFLAEATRLTSSAAHRLTTVVIAAFEQAKRDLAALRLYDLDEPPHAWTPAAGLPIYTALFGRDSLTAAWQAALASPALMAGTLPTLARFQGQQTDDWRDEEPGRMLHQADTGPLAQLNITPLGRYYGSITTSAFYPVVVAQLWHWTGDKTLVQPLLEPALKGLQWLDQYSDRDGDGFYEYQTRSSQGLKHQAWKDSGDAIVDVDGAQLEPPIATCEEQGFAYIAKFLMAEVLLSFNRKDDARRLYREAQELKQRFNDAFWMDDEGFIALGLDAQKRPIRSIASNAGHCLATGIVEQERAERVAQRLMAEDLFSGWGIRTLSARHPAYNPYSYHRGSVWPVEQGTFALGFWRYGLIQPLHLLTRAQFEATALFEFHRLPELFSGHPRDAAHPFPALYPQANWPQAWSASAGFCSVQALLGLYPYAPLKMLIVDPQLPEWLPELTLADLHVGDATVTIRFFRKADGSSGYHVEDLRGSLHVVRQPSPWSLTAGLRERVTDALVSLLPGK